MLKNYVKKKKRRKWLISGIKNSWGFNEKGYDHNFFLSIPIAIKILYIIISCYEILLLA